MAKLNDLDFNDVSNVLEYWNMKEFVDFVKEKQINGRTLQDVSEGMVELWSPTADAEKLILFLKDMEKDPQKYLKCLDKCMNYDIIKVKETNLCSESEYQTVSVRKISHQENTNNKTVEEILKKITVPKSFLYRHAKRQEKSLTSYVPMDAGTENKPKKFFRLSSYDYPIFDLKIQFPKVENFSDRGYYFIKPSNKSCSQKTCNNTSAKPKYKSLTSPEELEDKVLEEHFYEDLCYNDINVENKERKDETRETRPVKPCIVKIHELFQSFKLPFFKKSVVSEEKNEENISINNKEREGNIYENSSVDMYDSVHVARDSEDKENTKQHNIRENDMFDDLLMSLILEKDSENFYLNIILRKTSLAVEDYLDPVQLNKDYCDVSMKEKDESFLNYILNYFESRLRSRRDISGCNTMCWWVAVGVPLLYNLSVRVTDGVLDVFYGIFHCLTDVVTETNDTTQSEESEAEPSCEQWERKVDMAARPLPVPVENEPYYMNVDRTEAENLLMGQPDGTFILRPSSQPSHAYTLTVSCANSVHNVGVRRRPDGRLALGFARKGERSFTSVTSLLRHHKKRRLLLVAGGGVIGGTTLNETPQYYQVPSNIPVL